MKEKIINEEKKTLKEYCRFISFYNRFCRTEFNKKDSLANSNMLFELYLSLNFTFKEKKEFQKMLDCFNQLRTPDQKLSYSDLIELQEVMISNSNFIADLICKKKSLDIDSYLLYNSKTKNFEYTSIYIKSFDTLLDSLLYVSGKLYFEVFCYVMPRLPGKNFKICPVCNFPFFYVTKKPKKYCSKECKDYVD